MKKLTDNSIIRLFAEALADITQQATAADFKTGDSREDISQFIEWAEEFERIYSMEDWIEKDYIETVDNFTILKMMEYNNKHGKFIG